MEYIWGYLQALKDNFSGQTLLSKARMFLSNFDHIEVDATLISHGIDPQDGHVFSTVKSS